MPEFSVNLGQLAEKIKGNLDVVVRKTTYELFRTIVLKTPVDTGRARGNWNVSQGAPDMTVTPNATGRRGEIQAEKALQFPAGGVVYMTNALPYIRVLEYGEYPNPPKWGTYLKNGQQKGDYIGPGYAVFSAGGFSKQAPQGMVRVSILEMQRNMQKVV